MTDFPPWLARILHATLTLAPSQSASKTAAQGCAVVALLYALLTVPSIAQASNDCAFLPMHYSARLAGQGDFVPIGDQLSLPPRLHPTASEVRFTLPPTTADCMLVIDRVSLYALSVQIDDQPPIAFDFFYPQRQDRFAAAGFTLPLSPHAQTRSVLISVTQLGVLSTRAMRIDVTTLLANERRISAMHALSLIAPLMMAVLVGLFWLRLRDRALAAYVALLVTLVLVTASLDGTLYFFAIGTPFAALRSMAHILLLSAFGIAISVFFREFLAPLDKSGERMYRVLVGAFAFTGVSSVLGIPVYSALIQHVTTLSLAVAVPLLLWQAIRSYRAGHPLAAYFLMGWLLPLAAIPVRLLAEYGVIEWGFWVRYLPRLCFLVEAMVFALGLADRILRIRIERDRAEQLRVRTERSLVSYRQLAEADALTGLSSRRALETEIQRWDSEAISGSCLFIDLDHFKQFNDQHGHAEGDEALRAVASELRSLMPDGCHLARYGGEEFVALMPQLELTSAGQIAERARVQIAATVAAPDGRPVTISIGVAARTAGQLTATMLTRADAALYRAKTAGRNRVEYDG